MLEKLRGADRFHQIGIESRSQCAAVVFFISISAQSEEPYTGRSGIIPECLRDDEARQIGKTNIADHQFRSHLFRHSQTVNSGLRDDRVTAPDFEELLEALGGILVVLDDESSAVSQLNSLTFCIWHCWFFSSGRIAMGVVLVKRDKIHTLRSRLIGG